MQLEWSRFLSGITAFKERQGMLWLFCLVLFILLWRKGQLKRHGLFLTSLILGILVICPMTAVVLLKGYTPFYDWFDLQLLLPTTLLIALLGVEVFWFLKDLDIPGLRLGRIAKNIISGGCVAAVLLVATNFHGFDQNPEADEHGVPMHVAAVFEALHQVIGDEPIVLAANSDLLQFTRLYDSDWRPFYGRDLWSGKSASYINSGYDKEYEYYSFLQKEQLTEEEQGKFISLINDGQVDCIIVPAFWLDGIRHVEAYDAVLLTDSYAGIIKKDLLGR